MTIHRFPNSSNIASVKYVGTTLTVQFRSSAHKELMIHYRYTGVPTDVYTELVNAESVGSAFYTLIRQQNYPFVKVEWNLPPRDAKGRFMKVDT